MGYDWDFSVLADPTHLKALGLGLRTSLELTAICLVCGTALGLLLGVLASPAQPESLGRFGRTRWGRAIMAGARIVVLFCVDLIRAVPLLILMFAALYGLPVLLGHQVPAFGAAATAMSLNLAAFVADLVRGARAGVSSGGILAARSLGMKQGTILRRIIVPEIVREILPPMTLLYITMFKMSTLASAITVYELLHTADAIINKVFKPLELYLALCVVFIAIVVPLSYAARYLESTRWFKRRTA